MIQYKNLFLDGAGDMFKESPGIRLENIDLQCPFNPVKIEKC